MKNIPVRKGALVTAEKTKSAVKPLEMSKPKAVVEAKPKAVVSLNPVAKPKAVVARVNKATEPVKPNVMRVFVMQSPGSSANVLLR